MATEIIMPKVDMVMETGTLVEWLKKEGETVRKGDPLFIILTDKASIEIESPESGVLAGVTAKPDDVVPVTQVIGYILKPGESLPKPAEAAKAAPPAAHPAAAPAQPAPTAAEAPAPAGAKGAVRATPLARKMARELGLDLSQVAGRGPLGRIYRADILAAAEKAPAAAPAPVSTTAAMPTAPASINLTLPNARERERIAVKGARAIIAQRLAYSFSAIPHIYETLTVDMSESVRLKNKIAPLLEKKANLKLSYTAIIALAVARLLPAHPYLNSSIDGDEIVLWQDVHLGIATALEDSLIVPVVRGAQERNLESMTAEMARLLEAARSKKLQPAEMSGSTFTISNLGMFGIEQFTAIINPPESSILAVGKMVDTPVVVDGQVVVRPMMSLTLGTDHRINDGARAARFLADLKAGLENPYLLI